MEQFTMVVQRRHVTGKLLAVILAAVLTVAAAAAMTGCSAGGLSAEEEKQLKADIVESTEHAMIINEFMCYMFGVDEDSDPAMFGGTSQFNNTVRLLKLNNYLEYADHIDLVKEERNKIVEKYESARGNVSEELKKMYDNYVEVSDLAFDPQNEDDTLETFVTEYKAAYEKAQEIYGLGK